MERISSHVQPAPVYRLDVGHAFAGLESQEKLYAHHMSRAAWLGARIIMNQVSPESEGIFDLIMELHSACAGDWHRLAQQFCVAPADLNKFLDFAATFLSNLGNYYGSGDQKFTPAISPDQFAKLVSTSSEANALFERLAEPMYRCPPSGLGFASEKMQTSYYLGVSSSHAEIKSVSQVLETQAIYPENTRLRKAFTPSGTIYEVMQASVNHFTNENIQSAPGTFGERVKITGGDHSRHLKNICDELRLARAYAANETQRDFLERYILSFETGDLEIYRESQRLWVADRSPRVENIFGFVEPYRDPAGVRAEWEGLVAISDSYQGKRLQTLVSASPKFIRKLPWVDSSGTNDGMGPFEKLLFEAPDLTSIDVLAYCSSIIFPGINLPNYNDIRQECGHKNVIIANRMKLEGSMRTTYSFLRPEEAEIFQKHKSITYYIWVVLHELLGHGTGKMLCETSPGVFNFHVNHPPKDPLTSEAIKTWYRHGETWTGQFGDLATTVDECRAELVGAYLMDDDELLSIFGVPNEHGVSASDVTYNIYLQLGVDGLRGLQNYNEQTGTWGQAHSQAHFAILKWLLLDGGGFMTVESDSAQDSIRVFVDRAKILTHGKLALGRMLLHLHIYRCTADVASCRKFYGRLSRVDKEHLAWRELVLKQAEPKCKFVQANTFVIGDEVVLKEYEANNTGVIDSWAERKC